MQNIYRLVEPRKSPRPILVTSPHSGSFYPPSLLSQSRLALEDLRRLEDCFVDELWDFSPQQGATLLALDYARAYIDVNRDALELDPEMFRAPLPIRAHTSSAKLRAGLGAIPRQARPGRDIYAEKIPFTDALQRIDGVYRPYHRQLESSIRKHIDKFGTCLLLDCHSMPSEAAEQLDAEKFLDVVLGNHHGQSCSEQVMQTVESAFVAAGFTVKRNDPYAGGYVTRHYGKPQAQVHAVQIEINRALYMNEDDFTKSNDFLLLREKLSSILKIVSEEILAIFARSQNLLAAE